MVWMTAATAVRERERKKEEEKRVQGRECTPSRLQVQAEEVEGGSGD